MTGPKAAGRSHWLLIVIGALLVLAGLAFLVGGVSLVLKGGSWYYLIAGVLLAAVGVALGRARPIALSLYALLFVGSAVWAVWEAGWQFWPLFARLFFFLGIAFVLALVAPLLRRKAGLLPQTGRSMAASGVLLVAIVASLSGMFVQQSVLNVAAETGRVPAPAEAAGAGVANWDNWGGNPGGERFARLDQINRDTVKDLKVAWTYRTGDVAENTAAGLGSEDQQTPLQIGETVYLCTPHNNVIALESDSGKEIWKTEINARNRTWMRCRGLAYADLGGKMPNRAQVDAASQLRAQVTPVPAACARRIYVNTVKAELIALDADTGKFCEGFGAAGRVDLRVGMGISPEGVYKVTSAPTLAGDVLVVGGFVTDNLSTDVPSGVVRGFDAVTGQLRWAFDAGNPAIKGLPPEGQTYTRGSPNVWSAMSYDPKLNLVFLPMGNAAPDLWGGLRTPEMEKYSSSVVALDASTGAVRWSFQTVHHDLWDFDIPMQPTLTDFPGADGKLTPAVVFGVKQGQIFVLDRVTGKPLTKVEEVPVPAGSLKGERYSPTQPLSTGMPSIGVKTLTEADMWGVTPFDQLLCRIDFREMSHHGLFEPPTAHKQLVFPGSLGGMNWGGISVDATSQTIFVNDMRLGLRAQAFEHKAGETIRPGSVPMTGSPYYVYKDRFLSALGVPCQAPPFGTMTAIDLKTQKVNWQVPVGTVKDTGPLGLKLGLPIPIGMPTIGGSMATQGGLLFFSASLDYYIRAFDSGTGQELWKSRLPVGSQATPITYKSPKNGKQYLLVSAGGARQSTDRGDYVIAYTLPGN
ncbi:MAG: membrane-bound PQQ-dependent dehydrogenase, glucose/quinate/shikimate family [Pseudomonadota bacterium]